MTSITGLSPNSMNNLRREAVELVEAFDRNNDGQISKTEAKRFVGPDSSSYTSRISDDFVMRHTTFFDRYKAVPMVSFNLADRNNDNKLSVNEMVNSYLEERDTNNDGRLSTWERMKMGVNSLRGQFEETITVTTGNKSNLEFDPLPRDYDRPRPPSVDADRPTPPGVDYDRPRPPRVDNDRPKPPSVDTDRPRPPQGDSDRPKPPSSDSSRRRPPGSN